MHMSGYVIRKEDYLRRLRLIEGQVRAAPAYNAWCEAAEAFQAGNQGFRSGSVATSRRELGTVVRVKNTDTGQKNWSLFSPVVVKVPGGAPASRALGFAASPHFTGNWPTGSNLFSPGDVLGVTQEPIPYGATGRVCIGGLTCALALDESNMTGQTYVEAKWESTQVPTGLGTSRLGTSPVLCRLDDTKYQDGVLQRPVSS